MTAPLSIDALQDALSPGPDDALREQRAAALKLLAAEGLPTTRHEDWKYTDLKAVYAINETWLKEAALWSAPAESATDITATVADIDADWLVIRNGLPVADSIDRFSKAGITVERLAATGISAMSTNPIAALNLAQLTDGLRISVEGDLTDARPIGLLFIDEADGTSVANSRIEIRVAANARAQFVEFHHSGQVGQHFANSVIDLETGSSSVVDLVRLQDRAPTEHLTTHLTIKPAEDSHVRIAGFDLGGALVRHDVTADLSQTGARVDIAGLYLADEKQHIDNHTRVDHRVGPAESSQIYKGILSGRARAVWNGKAVVHVGADGTNAEQANHNILLSRRAEVDTKPELEIYAEDVRCSHGTTVGALDERALFYLRSRGLDQPAARALLVRAFAQQIVQSIPINNIEEAVGERVATRVAQLIEGAGND